MKRKQKASTTSPILNTTPQVEYGSKEYDNIFYGKFLRYMEKTTDQDCKDVVLTYLKANNKPYLNLESVHSKNFKPVGLYLKMEQDGIRLPETEKNLLESGIENFVRLDAKKGIELQQNKKIKLTREKYLVQKTISEILISIENQVILIQKNQKYQFDFKTFISNLTGNVVKLIENEMKDVLGRNIKEIKLAKNKKDVQLVEAYSYLTNKQLKLVLEFYENLYEKLKTGLIVKTRSPRKIKPKSPDKLIKKLKYKKEDTTVGLKSQNPVDIIGSCVVYVYNTKTRFICKYESDSASIRGSTIINIDENKSKKKKIRNPNSIFASLNPTNGKFMERLWDGINSKELLAKTRINEDCIILSCINKSS